MSATDTQRPIPPDLWGRDHWTTFVYVGHAIVSNEGEPERDKMRAHRGSPRTGASMALLEWAERAQAIKDKKPRGPWEYRTRLAGGAILDDDSHDDWSCAEDAEAAELLVNVGTGFQPIYRFTAVGLRMWCYITDCGKYPTAGSMDALTWAEAVQGAVTDEAIASARARQARAAIVEGV